MASNQESDNLLESLKRLFFRVSTLRAESRTKSGASNNTTSSQDIISPLSAYIDKLATNANNKPRDTSNSQTPESKIPPHDYTPANQEPSSSNEPGELTQHLKETHRYSGISTDTGEKLMHSTWEHFHTAIRLGNQGDIKAARVHIELTNAALKEAAHYLPESVYARFSKDVIEALEQMNKAKD